MLRLALLAIIAAPLSAQDLALREFGYGIPAYNQGAFLAAAGDLNGDGDPDVLHVSGNRPPRMLFGNGDGTFDQLINPNLVRGITRSIALGDLDGDGDLDAYLANDAVTCSGSQCFQGADLILWNNGAGGMAGFFGPQPPVRPDVRSDDVALGDVDGDGDLDVFVGVTPQIWSACVPCPFNIERPQNVLLINDGAGNFTPSVQPMTQAAEFTRSVELFDVDGDGDLDAYVANYDGTGSGLGEDGIYFNDGTGAFDATSTPVPEAVGIAEDLHAVDVDGDGDLDLFRLSVAVQLLRNDGNGGFTAAPFPIHLIPRNLLVGDWDRDGDPDVTIQSAVSSGSTLQTYVNNGSGRFRLDAGRALATSSPNLVAADFDGDGDTDLMAPSGGYNNDQIFFENGSAWIPEPVPFENELSGYTDHVLVDLDGDGDLDAAAVAQSIAPNAIYLNDGWGEFTPTPGGDFTTDIENANGVAAGDIDGDGDIDLVVANAGSSGSAPAARLYRNQGDGAFAGEDLAATNTYDVQLGDLDGDGALDAVLGAPTGVFVLRNHSGTFSSGNNVPGVAGAIRIELADVDGDGDLDAITMNWIGQDNHVLRNDGTGLLVVDATPLPLSSRGNFDLAVGDLDGDGDVDVLIGNDGGQNPQANDLLLNDGNGSFTAAPYANHRGRTVGVHLADLDEDGDLDVLEAEFTGIGSITLSGARVLENDGTGAFTEVAGGLPTASTYSFDYETGDLDQDGDIDAFLITTGPPHVHSNVRRQLATRALPRIGGALVLDVFGPPGEATAVAGSLLPSSQPFPGVGVLGLDPVWLSIVGTPVLNAQGCAELSLAVPPLPNLLGLSVYWQAIVGTSPRLTNRVTSTFYRL